MKKKYHHENLKAALLEEAGRIILTAGPEAVTMRELSKRLGVSRMAAYRHFTDKRELLEAVGHRGGEILEHRIRQSLNETRAEGSELLRRLFDEYVNFAREYPGHYKLMFSSAARNNMSSEMREKSAGTFELFRQVMDAAQERDGVSDCDVVSLANAAWAAAHGVATLIIDEQIQGEKDIAALIRTTKELLLAGLKRA